MTPSITNVTPAPKAAAAPQAPKQQGSKAPEFAEMLSQETAASEPPQAPAETQRPEAPKGENRAEGREHSDARAESKKGDKAGQGDKCDKAASSEKADGERKAADESKADELKEVAAGTTPEWLASLNLPATPAQPKAAKPVGDAAEGDLPADAVRGKAGKGARHPLASVGHESQDKNAKQAARDTQELRGAHDARDAQAKPDALHADTIHTDAKNDSAWQAALERVATPEKAQASHELPTVNAAGQLEAMAQPSRGADSTAAVSITVQTPATSPEFAETMGVQISVLAKQGVQEAKLDLNPAEMGPISVRISIDGTQARVEFGADVAATRGIIENGLPQLAAAMRDAGFTLSGGGVHSQARGRGEGSPGQPGEGSDGSRNNGALDATDTPARRIQARVGPGGVDLYA